VAPTVTTEVVADVCWMVEQPVQVGSRFVAKHLARHVAATVTEIVHRLDPETLTPVAADALVLNDLGRVRLALAEPIVADRYTDQRAGGRLVLVDPVSNATAGALMVRQAVAG
jgi:sulfate adenylyltransferase subunit 1